MSYTRSRGSTSYTTRRTAVKPTEVEMEDGAPKCSGHNRRAKDFTAGSKTKNPGRKFYVCPLGKDDPDKCKFFKWADELFADGTEKSPGGAAEIIAAARERYGGPPKSVQPQSFGGAGQSLGGPPRTLGQEPQSRTTRPAAATAFTPTTSRVAPITPQTTSRIISKAPEEEADDIDWDKVDTDSLERDAIASTPGSSQQDATNSETLQERLLAVSPLAATKRKREDDDDNTPKVDRTPKRPVTGDDDNPFISPTHYTSPAHHALSPSLTSFEELSAHLYRQDRLISAGERAKEGFRKTIQSQKQRIEELEQRVRELEGR